MNTQDTTTIHTLDSESPGFPSPTTSVYPSTTTLNQLERGQRGVVAAVHGEGSLRQHILDMGIVPGVEIAFSKAAPLGDPLEYLVREYKLSLRAVDAARVDVVPSPQGEAAAYSATSKCTPSTSEIEHPGLGEGGRYHVRATENPLPDNHLLTFALAGNQNSGKTTLFNQLTGANQHVGNFPGVTVDTKDGPIKNHDNTCVVDLPGIYSMSPYSNDEIVARAFILNQKPTGIINVVDATNIERNLYLTMQLMELDIPLVIALNMMDEVQKSGGAVRINEMEAMLGVPVVPISAVHNEGVDELVEHAVHIAHFQERPGRLDFCGANDHGGAVHRCLHSIMHLIDDHASKAGIPLRFAATKLVEGDERIIDSLKLDANELEAIERIVMQMERERGLDRAAAIADMRYAFIEKVACRCVVKPATNPRQARSAAIDHVLTGRWSAIPLFFAIMFAIFLLTFNIIGPLFQDLFQMGLDALSEGASSFFTTHDTNPVLESFVVEGVINGVGTILLFLPIIVTMFFFLSLLEDTGYMARIAFIMDRLLRRIGLSGRSIVPMLMGFGCTVPAIMATRTLPSERDRKLTILLTPFMSCATKLTIYGFIATIFFPRTAGFVMIALYLLGILVGIVTGFASHRIVFTGEAVPFVLELPPYRMPSARSVGRLVWDKSKDFMKRAFTIIFVATIIVWFLQWFTPAISFTEDPEESILALVSGWIAPLFAPLGLGDWRFATALVTGFMAKETVVTTLSVLFGNTGALMAAITPTAAAAFLVFCLLYTPCVAAIATVNRELGRKWAVGIVLFQCAVAWVCALAVRLIGLALGFA